MGTITESVVLRTLTRKSIIRETGTEYDGKLVQDLIDTNQGALVYLYYYMPKLTFVDEILDTIYIYDVDRIAKPGIGKEEYRKRRMKMACSKASKGDWRMFAKIKKDYEFYRLRKWKETEMEVERLCSDANLTCVNQGHRYMKRGRR